MTQSHDLSAKDRRRRERRIWRIALLTSVLLHAVVLFGWRGTVIPLSPFAAAGPRAGDNRAAKGAMQALNVRSRASVPITPPPIPLPADVEVPPVELKPLEETDPAAVLGDAPGGQTAGLDTGTGRGDAGTAAEGFFRLQPPSPRGMIIPPTNRKLKGTTVEVWVFVDETGRVVPDSTRLNPPTKDRRFNQRLIREAAEWVFRPAIKAGKPVASWFPYTISM